MSDTPAPTLTLADITAEKLIVGNSIYDNIMDQTLTNLILVYNKRALQSATLLRIQFAKIRKHFNANAEAASDTKYSWRQEPWNIESHQFRELVLRVAKARTGKGVSYAIEEKKIKVNKDRDLGGWDSRQYFLIVTWEVPKPE